MKCLGQHDAMTIFVRPIAFDPFTRLNDVYHVACLGIVLSDHRRLSNSYSQFPPRAFTLFLQPVRIVLLVVST